MLAWLGMYPRAAARNEYGAGETRATEAVPSAPTVRAVGERPVIVVPGTARMVSVTSPRGPREYACETRGGNFFRTGATTSSQRSRKSSSIENPSERDAVKSREVMLYSRSKATTLIEGEPLRPEILIESQQSAPAARAALFLSATDEGKGFDP